MSDLEIVSGQTFRVDDARFSILNASNGEVEYRDLDIDRVFTEPVESFLEHIKQADNWSVKEGPDVAENWWYNQYQGGHA